MSRLRFILLFVLAGLLTFSFGAASHRSGVALSGVSAIDGVSRATVAGINGVEVASGGFSMPANLVASFYAGDAGFAALADGTAATGHVDALAGSTWTTAAGTITKQTFRGLPVLDLAAAGAIFRCGSVFDGSFNQSLTVVYIALADVLAANQTVVSNGGIFTLGLSESGSGANRFSTWFGVTAGTGAEYSPGQIVAYRYDGANVYQNRNNFEASVAKTGDLGLSGNLDIGAASFGFAGNVRLVLVFNRCLSDAEIESIVAEFGPASQGFTGNNVIQCFGDSQTGTTGGSGSVSYPEVMRSELDTAVYQYNYIWTNAVSGRAIREFLDDDAELIAGTDPFVNTPNTSGREIACIWMGTNDIRNDGVTGAVASARLDALIVKLQARGFTHFVIGTCLPCTADTGGQTTAVAAYNAHIAGLASATVKVVALHSHASLDDPADTNFYNADGLHLKDAGKTIVGQLMATAVQLFP